MALGRDPRGAALFWACAALALVLHLTLQLREPGLRGGADLVPHLGLIEWMRADPALRNVYAPAYHVLGALLSPLVGLTVYPRLFALASAVAILLAFRFFQRAAGLPDASAALFALTPYLLNLSWCIPKVELAGYAVGLVGLGCLVRRRYAALALCVPASLFVHTAGTLVFGLAAGVLALAARDWRALGALAVGTLAALPLVAAHVHWGGCTVPEALLFTRSGYVGGAAQLFDPRDLAVSLALAGPIAVAAAILGARATWRSCRPVAWMALALVLLYLNNVFLAPIGIHTAGGLRRGLSVLAIPVAIAGGVFLAGRPFRFAAGALAACALYAAVAAVELGPRGSGATRLAGWVSDTCFTRSISLDELERLRVARCTFSWGGPNIHKRERTAPGLPTPRRVGPR